jgi:hypothetical protein
MKRWLVITGAIAWALAGNAAYAKQSGAPARSNDAIGQARISLSPNPFAEASRPPAAVSGPADDVVAGTTFVGRDPDRHIRFQILRDSKF